MELVVDSIIFELNPSGGVARMFRELLPALCQSPLLLRLWLLENRPLHDEFRDTECFLDIRLNPPIDRLLRPRRLWWPVIPWASGLVKNRATRRLKNAIWHSTYYTLPANWHGPQVVTVYDMLYERYPSLFATPIDHYYRAQKQAAILAADVVVCISHTTAADVIDYLHVDPNRIRVVPLAHSAVFTHERDLPLPGPGTQPFLLYVGDRRPYKQLDLLLNAYNVWRHRHDISLVIVGRPWSKVEQKKLIELGLLEQVHLLTHVDDQLLCRLYNHAVALVYPSLYEGFGLPLLEAAACGCPVVASRIPSTLEVAETFPIYFESGHIEQLVAALDQTIDARKNKHRIQEGFRLANQYSWNRTTQAMLDIYAEF